MLTTRRARTRPPPPRRGAPPPLRSRRAPRPRRRHGSRAEVLSHPGARQGPRPWGGRPAPTQHDLSPRRWAAPPARRWRRRSPATAPWRFSAVGTASPRGARGRGARCARRARQRVPRGGRCSTPRGAEQSPRPPYPTPPPPELAPERHVDPQGVVATGQPRAREHLRDGRGRRSLPRVATDPHPPPRASASAPPPASPSPGARPRPRHLQLHERADRPAAPARLHARDAPPQPSRTAAPASPTSKRRARGRCASPRAPRRADRPPSRLGTSRSRRGSRDLVGLQAHHATLRRSPSSTSSSKRTSATRRRSPAPGAARAATTSASVSARSSHVRRARADA